MVEKQEKGFIKLLQKSGKISGFERMDSSVI